MMVMQLALEIQRSLLCAADLSPCLRRVRITLIEKGLDFDAFDVDLANMQ
jgi:glutathione S-transferase